VPSKRRAKIHAKEVTRIESPELRGRDRIEERVPHGAPIAIPETNLHPTP
jgi:hypothetical protein